MERHLPIHSPGATKADAVYFDPVAAQSVSADGYVEHGGRTSSNRSSLEHAKTDFGVSFEP